MENNRVLSRRCFVDHPALGATALGVLLLLGCARITLRNLADIGEWSGQRREGVHTAMFSPNGKHILVVYRRGSKYQHLYRVASDGSSCEQLTHGERFDFSPAYSPDGRKIVFSSPTGWMSRRINLFIMDADGSNLQQLTKTDSVDWGARFSPDGRKIVFSSSRDGRQADLFLMNADGTGVNQLTKDDEHDINPVFFPDGERILFWAAGWFGHSSPIASSDWHAFAPYTMSVGGGRIAPLTEEHYYRLKSPSLSPDGKWVLFASTKHWGPGGWLVSVGAPCEEQEIRPKGSRYVALQGAEEEVRVLYDHCFSPDSKSILFAMALTPGPAEHSYPRELHIMDLATSEARQITRLHRHIIEPRYSPDNSQILFRVDPKPVALRGRYELWVMNADGSNPHRIDLDVEDYE